MLTSQAANHQVIHHKTDKNTASFTPLLSCRNLSWKINHQLILNDISFDVQPGSFIGVLGANGAGKSSLLRCLYRYLKPDSGDVLLTDTDDVPVNIWQITAQHYAQQVAVVLQETSSQFNMTVHQVVALGLVPHKTLFSGVNKEDKKCILQALTHVGLADKSEQHFESLSGGEKQRALIARAIVQKPRLLIMDEPTSHLDVKYQIQIMALAKSLGITVIASCHDLNLASAICDKLLVLKGGSLVAHGSPKDVITPSMLAHVFGVRAHVILDPQSVIPHITYVYDDSAIMTTNLDGLLIHQLDKCSAI